MSRILVVDDDAHIRELVGVFLRKEGLDVYEANDGIEALQRLATIKADLVILDVMMPNMDGWGQPLSRKSSRCTRARLRESQMGAGTTFIVTLPNGK